ncbi:hypothetical protein [Onishia taeanensis]|uniref:hypothetical protein n=2 Tax=Halomonadaceae TaxID=28256 RepID=UPI0015834307|nr:hypothetical protein [Halomonas taeanensis]MDI4638548.1 hypothetical protein [Halomonas sp. BMC7]NUJ59534.1 hypothetical protein [Halomonas taeanensis]
MLSIEEIEAMAAAFREASRPHILSYTGVIVLSWAGAFLAAYLVQKAKNRANSEDFHELKNQLRDNTRIVKEIESTFSENFWIRQQVWVKKQESYETILCLLHDIEKYVSHQVTDFEEWEYINHRHPYFGFYPHEDIGNVKAWERDKKEYEEKQQDPETVAESQALKTRYDRALSEIFDHIELKSIYLDSRVASAVEELKRSLSRTDEHEDWEDHFTRISSDTTDAIRKIREISRLELKLDA